MIRRSNRSGSTLPGRFGVSVVLGEETPTDWLPLVKLPRSSFAPTLLFMARFTRDPPEQFCCWVHAAPVAKLSVIETREIKICQLDLRVRRGKCFC